MKTLDNTENKTIKFLFQETAIHFLINPNDENVMVNATEMGIVFQKRPSDFLKQEKIKEYIEEYLGEENMNFDVANSLHQKTETDIFYTTNKATYMHRHLAIKFAVWLDVKFDIWVTRTIDAILLGKTKQVQSAISFKQQQKKEREALIKKAVEENNTDLLDLLKVDKAIAKAEYQEQKAVKELKSQYKMDI